MVQVRPQLFRWWLVCLRQRRAKHSCMAIVYSAQVTWTHWDAIWVSVPNTMFCLTCWRLMRRLEFFRSLRVLRAQGETRLTNVKNYWKMWAFGSIEVRRVEISLAATKGNYRWRLRFAANQSLWCWMSRLQAWICKRDVTYGICFVHTGMTES